MLRIKPEVSYFDIVLYWIVDILTEDIETIIILNYHACGLDIIQSMIHRGRPPAWELIYFDDMNNFLINKKAQFLIDS